jgi:hypothetical protein
VADPGWYRDPQNPTVELYWTGSAWTGDRRAATAPPMPDWGARPSETLRHDGPGPDPTVVLPPLSGPSVSGPGPWAPRSGAWSPPAAPANRRRRTPVVLGAVALLVIAAGLITWVAWPDSKPPKFTWHGQAIAAPDTVLRTAESHVRELVRQRHGVAAKTTRCYYSRAVPVPAGTKESDVQDKLFCGPVLFIDGDPAATYLPVTVSAGAPAKGKTPLTPARSLTGVDPLAVPSGTALVRPDGVTASSGAGGLTAPTPPPAAADVLTTAVLGPVATQVKPLSDAVLIGRDTGVELTAAGRVGRYGVGDAARSAPAGQELIAFRTASRAGDLTRTGTAPPQLVVGTGAPRSIPQTAGEEYVVVAVPTGTLPQLRLTDAGVSQELALPTGTAGKNNLAVLYRRHRVDVLGRHYNVPIHLSNANGSTDVTFRASIGDAGLAYWVPGHADVHPSDAEHAVLTFDLTYTDSGSPGHTYGFDPAVLRLVPNSGGSLKARNVAGAGRIYNVFDVPAGFTGGTLEITGHEKVGSVNVKVRTTIRIPLSFPTG